MSEPQTTDAYLTAINAGLAVGLRVVVSMLCGAAFAVVGAALGRDAVHAANAYLAGGMVLATICIVSRSYARSLRDWTTNSMASLLWPSVFAYPAVVSCLVLLVGEYSFAVEWVGGLFLVYALLAVSHPLIEGAINRAARGYLAASEQDRRPAWSADRPWLSAVAGVAPVPIGLVTLITVYPGAVALRVALVALVAAITALAVAAVRLQAARRERDFLQPVSMSEAT